MTGETYFNPVYPHSCPDPFVLKHDGEYWCYFTGIQPDGRCFGILHSTDLVRWQPVSSALDRLVPGTISYPDNCYWAPEIIHDNGVFYMYYSVGNEENMQIRVATSRAPAGPFIDRGVRLTSEIFAIDAHVFTDEDGSRYLFYATDYLDHDRVGTGTAVDCMLDWFTIAGNPHPVTRACYDWQIFDPQRSAKGGIRWHTLEGPFVLKYQGRYYQLFSAGNWHNSSYGVAYGVTDDINTQNEWEQPVDGVHKLPLLHSIPEHGVIGPGHNSVVLGPNDQELYCVYHRWQSETNERVLAIDRMGWNEEGPEVYGPSFSPQPAPG